VSDISCYFPRTWYGGRIRTNGHMLTCQTCQVHVTDTCQPVKCTSLTHVNLSITRHTILVHVGRRWDPHYRTIYQHNHQRELLSRRCVRGNVRVVAVPFNGTNMLHKPLVCTEPNSLCTPAPQIRIHLLLRDAGGTNITVVNIVAWFKWNDC
jgi:hypothetical protein